MSGLFGSITIRGNRLTEFSGTTATVGTPIPFGYGAFECDGNVIFAPMPPKEHVTKKKQGKGGVKSEEYTYTLSYAVAFCAGPIFGYLTIKRNGKVVYTTDPNASVEDKAYAQKWAQKATFYYGTETQLPDSIIESYKGAGKVSAFRGIAYIVVEDDDVTDGGGAVPQYTAVVMASAELNLTSPPYPVEAVESPISGGAIRLASVIPNLVADDITASAALVAAEVSMPLRRTTMEPESVTSESELVSTEIKTELHFLTADTEALNGSIDYVSSQVKTELVIHTQPYESVTSQATLISTEIE